VRIVPGPSAVEAALVASGLPAEPFAFVGFFPRRATERRRRLEELNAWPGTVVGFESPNRLPALLADVAALDPDRQVAVCRELTKLHEEVLRGTAAEVRAALVPERRRGEMALVLSGCGRRKGPQR